MTSDEREKRNESVPNTDHASRITPHLPALFAGVALVLLFAAALQMDRPTIEFVRTLHAVWIEQIGDAGYLIGKGETLAAISGLFVAIGYLRKRPELYQAGLRGWAAHAVTAILVQSLKHGIGRPRPRLHREDEFFTGPSLESGLDSFPSGHTSASFAVATVIVKHFPRFAWPVYALAGYVSLTRVFRGSHFVSDSVAGVVLGLVIGTLAATPVQEWGPTARYVLLVASSWLVVVCAAIWLAILPSSGTLATGLLAAAGASVLLARLAQARGER